MKRFFLIYSAICIFLTSCDGDADKFDRMPPEPIFEEPTGVGIIGGFDFEKGQPYAFFTDIEGQTRQIQFDPAPDSLGVLSVSLDVAGKRGLIVGNLGTFPSKGFAFTVVNDPNLSPPKAIQISNFPDSDDVYYSCAVSESGAWGLIGGNESSSFSAPPVAYAVDMFNPSIIKTLTPSGSSGALSSVAINTNGDIGVIGGGGFPHPPFVHRITEITTTPLTSANLLNPYDPSQFPNPDGGVPATPIEAFVRSVAINRESPTVILTGGIVYNSAGPPYGFASRIDAKDNVTPVNFNPDSVQEITSVAMNRAGTVGILGGYLSDSGDSKSIAYMVDLTDASSQLTPTKITPDVSYPPGSFESVAIDSAGSWGLLGGVTSNGPLAYTVDIQNNKAYPIDLSAATEGIVLSVEIQDGGNAGLLGGDLGAGKPPLAYLVQGIKENNPVATQLNLSPAASQGTIHSVFFDSLAGSLNSIQTRNLSENNLTFAEYINQNKSSLAHFFLPETTAGKLSPAIESASPLRNVASLFASDNAFFSIAQGLSSRARDARQFRRLEEKEQKELAHLAGKRENTFEITNYPKEIRLNNLWVETTGLIASQEGQDQTPGFDPWSIGVLGAYDAQKTKNFRAGLGVAYAYTHLDFDKENGGSTVNQEYLTLYGLWNRHNAYANLGIWFGLFQTDHMRKVNLSPFAFETSSYTLGYQFDPHAEIGYDFIFKEGSCTFEPFVVADWIHNWQAPYKEHGGPFTFVQQKLHASMLRAEVGIRVYEEFEFSVWNLVLQQNLSYIYKDTFSLGNWKGFLLGAPGNLILNNFTQSEELASLGFSMLFDPKKPLYPSGRIGYKGEFGAEYRSHQITASTEWSF